VHALNVAEHTGLLCALVCCILRSVFGCERNELTAGRFGILRNEKLHDNSCCSRNIKMRPVNGTRSAERVLRPWFGD
jgi:hypothetical protein